MKRALLLTSLVVHLTAAAHAQFSNVVYDPAQNGHAIQQITQAQQLYTTALQTRNTVISAYNLAQQMANLPNSLYRQYVTPWTQWNYIATPANTYGNVIGWINAANTGNGVPGGYQATTISTVARYPFYASLDPQSQQLVAAQGATNDLADSISQSNLYTLGQIRASSAQREADIRTLEAATYSADPNQHTDMATLQRINQATLMQLRAQQDSNQITQAIALQQMIAQKQQQDALKAALNDAANFQQQYDSAVTPLMSGMGNTMLEHH